MAFRSGRGPKLTGLQKPRGSANTGRCASRMQGTISPLERLPDSGRRRSHNGQERGRQNAGWSSGRRLRSGSSAPSPSTRAATRLARSSPWSVTLSSPLSGGRPPSGTSSAPSCRIPPPAYPAEGTRECRHLLRMPPGGCPGPDLLSPLRDAVAGRMRQVRTEKPAG